MSGDTQKVWILECLFYPVFSEDTQQMWTLQGFSLYPLLSWDTQPVLMLECLFYPELSGVTQQVWVLARVWRRILFCTTWRHTARVNVRFILSSAIWDTAGVNVLNRLKLRSKHTNAYIECWFQQDNAKHVQSFRVKPLLFKHQTDR